MNETETTKQADARTLDQQGTDAAARFLQSNGYEILERDWSCKFGSTDIIARQDDGTIAFLDVLTRMGIDEEMPDEDNGPEERHKAERITMAYMVQADWTAETAVRFDHICICVADDNRALLRHHKARFDGFSF